jgi:hypothetical protein
MRDDKLRSDEPSGLIYMAEAVFAFTGGEPESLRGMSAEEIETLWNDCLPPGESLPWDAADIVEYVETLND